jgi:hypothetical protein
MKRTIYSLAIMVVLAGLVGCVTQRGRRPWACMGGSCAQSPENGKSCDASCGASCATCEDTDPGRKCKGHVCRLHRQRAAAEAAEVEQAPAGPSSGAITYPYYTTRGPRDFLAKSPASIGP